MLVLALVSQQWSIDTCYVNINYAPTGSNAIRALHGLGLMDAVLARIKESKANKMLFTFIAGEGDHERIFDVRAIDIHPKTTLTQTCPVCGYSYLRA